MDEVSKLLLKCEEAAKLLGLGRSKVYLMAARRELPTVRIGRAIRIPADALREWVERKRAETEDSASTG